MTGYGLAEHRDAAMRASVELRSYNNRFLEVFVNLPGELRTLEPRIREYIAARVGRGKVEAGLTFREGDDPAGLVVDAGRARAAARALADLRKAAGIRGRVQLSDLLALEAIAAADRRGSRPSLFSGAAEPDPEALWGIYAPLLERAFADFDAAKSAEGKNTETEVTRLLAEIASGIGVAETHAREAEERIRSGLQERFRDVLGEKVDESRILAETAVLLVRFDINEEIVRLKAHVRGFEDSMRGDPQCGKKLDFFCQEINREVNTIGSKSMILEIDAAVIRMKDALEKIRELIRNVE